MLFRSAGGMNGSPNQLTVRFEDDDAKHIDCMANGEPHAAGQALEYVYGGGGGWGDPLLREAQAVCDDVLDEYVSVESAREHYGVVLTGSKDDYTLAVHEEGPEKLRPQLPANRDVEQGS